MSRDGPSVLFTPRARGHLPARGCRLLRGRGPTRWVRSRDADPVVSEHRVARHLSPRHVAVDALGAGRDRTVPLVCRLVTGQAPRIVGCAVGGYLRVGFM